LTSKQTTFSSEVAKIIGTYGEEVVVPTAYAALDAGKQILNIPLRASGFDEFEELTEEEEEERGKIGRLAVESVIEAIPFLDSEDVYTEEGEIKEAESLAGQVGQVGMEIVPYIAGFAGAAKSLGALGMKEGLARTAAATVATEQVLSDPYDNIFNQIEEHFPEASQNIVVDFLAADEDDSEVEARLKMLVQDVGLGVLVETGIVGTKFLGSTTNQVIEKITGLNPAEEAEIALRYFKDVRDEVKTKARSSQAQRVGMDIESSRKGAGPQIYDRVKPREDIASDKELLTETQQGIKQSQRQTTQESAGFLKKNLLKPTGRVYGRFLSSRGYFTPKAYNAFRESQYAQRQTITQAEDIANRLTLSMKRVVEGTEQGAFPTANIDNIKDIPNRVQEALTRDSSIIKEMPREERFQYFASAYNLPENIAKEVAEARELMDTLSYKIIGSKGFKQDAKNSIRENVGSYMRRSYRMYEDPLYEPSDIARENAVQYLVDDILDRTPDIDIDVAFSQASKRVDDIVGLEKDKEVVDYLAQVRRVAKFKKRTDIPEPIRALMGEIKEAPESIILSVAKASRVYEVNNFYRQFNELGKTGGYLTAKESGLNTSKIEGTNSILDGKFTTPEMLKALERKQEEFVFFTESGKIGKLVKDIATLKGLSQGAVTVLSHTAHLRNFLGSTQMAIANGANPFDADAAKMIANRLSRGGDKAKDEFYQELQSLGVINTSVKVNESRALLEVGFEREPSRVMKALRSLKYNPAIDKLEGVDSAVVKGVEAASNLYQASDDFFKASNYLNELEVLKKAFPNTAEDVLKAEAARKVRSTFVNYDMVPPGIKAIRDMPFGNFVSFPAEIHRTTINIVKEAAKELRSGNNVLRARGAKRLTGFMTAGLGFGVAAKTSGDLMGWTEEERKAHDTLAEGTFYKDSNKIWGRDDDGEIYFIDTKFLDTYETVKRPVMILADRIQRAEISGNELDRVLFDTSLDMAVSLLEPFATQEMISEAAVTATNKYLDDRIDAEDVLVEMLNTFMPGSVRSGINLAEAINKTPPRIGNNFRKTQNELAVNMTGVRRNSYDPDLQLKFAVIEYNDTATKNIDRLFDNYTSEDEYLKRFQKQQDKLYKAQQELFRIVNAHATIYGYDDTTNVLMNNGVSNEGAAYLVGGLFKAKSPRGKVIEEAFDAFNITNSEAASERLEKLQDGLADIVSKMNGSSLYDPDYDAPLLRGVELPVIDKETGERVQRAKGGEVLNVPQVPVEPDQRIDKMTGMPYDQQAGTAFVDEEDPLRRMGFVGGGNVDPLRRLGFGNG